MRPGLVAQLDRVPPSEGGSRWFESSRAHIIVSRCFVMIRASFIGLAFVTAMAACSSSGRTPGMADGALDADATSEDAPSGDAPSDADVTNATCQQIRMCVAGGGGVDTCQSRGTPQAQGLYTSLLSCLSTHCPEMLFECVCRETCQPDGFCLAEIDACMTASGVSIDSVCDHSCGG